MAASTSARLKLKDCCAEETDREDIRLEAIADAWARDEAMLTCVMLVVLRATDEDAIAPVRFTGNEMAADTCAIFREIRLAAPERLETLLFDESKPAIRPRMIFFFSSAVRSIATVGDGVPRLTEAAWRACVALVAASAAALAEFPELA